MPFPMWLTIQTPLLLYVHSDTARRHRALRMARRWRRDPGPVLEWFGTGQTIPASPGLVLQIREGLLSRQPSEPPITFYIDQVEWRDMEVVQLLRYYRRAGLRCLWGFDPENADWEALALLGFSPRAIWPTHQGWWMPTTYFQEPAFPPEQSLCPPRQGLP